ncbi:MAG: PaaI family thioesterase [Pseudomonadales bacterium]
MEMEAFFSKEFPQASFVIESFDEGSVTIRRKVDEGDLRPGGTVSGPTMMGLADCAIYAAILREIGLVALAVTTSLNINFLRKPVADKDILGVCKILKLGKTLAIGEVTIYSEGDDRPIAHSVGTYSIPPNK